ncbi:unnamed protein product [Lactuca virosa]|uniref:Secreted protein n=1 Tax=Lactuca virosa TaxID=75947 RepID=A0AAU9LM32_9ASTR|nr:unnamed protein product [Lactuca virosa]
MHLLIVSLICCIGISSGRTSTDLRYDPVQDSCYGSVNVCGLACSSSPRHHQPADLNLKQRSNVQLYNDKSTDCLIISFSGFFITHQHIISSSS